MSNGRAYTGVITFLNSNSGSAVIYVKELGRPIEMSYQGYPCNFIPHQDMEVVIEQDRNGAWMIVAGIKYD